MNSTLRFLSVFFFLQSFYQRERNIPENLFELGKEDIEIKAHLLKKQYNKDPSNFAKIIQRMLRESK